MEGAGIAHSKPNTQPPFPPWDNWHHSPTRLASDTSAPPRSGDTTSCNAKSDYRNSDGSYVFISGICNWANEPVSINQEGGPYILDFPHCLSPEVHRIPGYVDLTPGSRIFALFIIIV